MAGDYRAGWMVHARRYATRCGTQVYALNKRPHDAARLRESWEAYLAQFDADDNLAVTYLQAAFDKGKSNAKEVLSNGQA